MFLLSEIQILSVVFSGGLFGPGDEHLAASFKLAVEWANKNVLLPTGGVQLEKSVSFYVPPPAFHRDFENRFRWMFNEGIHT